jgi:hypothetical protein
VLGLAFLQGRSPHSLVIEKGDSARLEVIARQKLGTHHGCAAMSTSWAVFHPESTQHSGLISAAWIEMLQHALPFKRTAGSDWAYKYQPRLFPGAGWSVENTKSPLHKMTDTSSDENRNDVVVGRRCERLDG